MPEFAIQMAEILTYEENVVADTMDEAIDQFMSRLENGDLEPYDAELETFQAESLGKKAEV